MDPNYLQSILIPRSGETYCPICHLRIGTGQADVISALPMKAHSIEQIQFYCGGHMKTLPCLGLSMGQIKELRTKFFQRPPTISETFHFAYAMELLSSSEDDKITKDINKLAKRFGIQLTTSRCINWAKSIERQPSYAPENHYFNPVVPLYKTRNNLIFAL